MTPEAEDDALNREIRDALEPTRSEVARLSHRAVRDPGRKSGVRLVLAAAAVLAAVALWPRGSRVEHFVVEEVDGFLVVHGREGNQGFVSRNGKRPRIGQQPIEPVNEERSRE